jgi:transposase InsO family protein
VRVRRVMTDNGTGYHSKVHRAAVAELGIRHLRTQPYRPCTNSKAERFIQSMLREWVYGPPTEALSNVAKRCGLAMGLQLQATPRQPGQEVAHERPEQPHWERQLVR